jgi:hypothetical protein
MMKKYLLAACVTLTLASSTSARDVDSMNDWVLLTLGWVNGEGAETFSAGLVPEFSNQGACQAALRRALQKDAHLSHAEGGGNVFLCTPLSAWHVASE